MDLLRFLATLPQRAAKLIGQFFHATGVLLEPVFGKVSWTRPAWIASVSAALRRRPKDYAAGAAGTVLALLLGWAGWQWYLHLPHPPEPERITMEVVTPAITDYELPDGRPGIVIHPLEIKFSGSAAPIELVGKTVKRGITTDPSLKGTWTWVDDKTLRFVPAADWAVGAHVEVQFDVAQVFAPHVLMADDHCAFDMPAFAVTTEQGEFYQDPQNPAAKKTIMPVTFNYPVDPTEFEKRVSLALKGRGDNPTPLKFTVTYDAAKLRAYVHSQPLDLPRDDDTVVMKLDSGVRSARGGEPTDKPLEMNVRVPGLYSLTVSDVTPTLVNNDRFEPEQVIVLSTSDTVKGTDLAAMVKAWVLPKRRAGHKQREDAPPYPWSANVVSDDVLRHSQPLALVLVPTENEYADQQSFKYKAEPGQRIYIRFAPGLKSFGGYILGRPNAQVFTAPDYPKLLRFMADGSLLSLSEDKRISVVSRNVPGMKLEIGRVLPDQLQHLVSLNDGTYTHPELNGRFGEEHIVERFDETRVFPHGAPGDSHYEGVDLSQYLKEGKHGIFLLHLSTFDPAEKKKSADDDSTTSDDSDDDSSDDSSSKSNSGDKVSDSRMIVVTDLGLLAKRALDGSLDVFVQSIHTGQPVGGATVSVLAINGATLYSETSSADGEVHFPTLKGLEHEKRPAMYLVKKGDDLSFLPIKASDRKLDYSRFDIGGEENPTSASELSAYLFSDRGIYRPGDLIHVGVIVRAADWAHSPANIPLEAEIVDPRGMTVKRQPVSVDVSGFTELAYVPSETAPTGTWTFNLYIAGKKTYETPIGTTTVSVKEFLPDSMKVDATLSAHVADGWVKPDKLKGIVDVHNLFGTPASDRRVEASLTLTPTFPAFRDWTDFQFYDLRHAKDGYTTQLQDGHTNDQGHAEFDLDLKKYADATYRLAFLAKAYEPEGGRNVAASAETLVSSNPWLVGYRTVDDLSYIRHGSPRSVRLVAIDPQTKSIELKGLTAQLIERRYVSVLTKQDSGVYKYESKLKEVPISQVPLTIPAGGMDYALATDKPGDYAVLIRNGDVNVNRIEYSVTGEANLSRSLDRNAELEIKLSKTDYLPGEAVEVSLRAPYAGSGLITIERDKVYAHAWFTARTTNSVQHITVPKDFEGNGYINVQYIRDPSSNEIFMSPLSYGVVPFSVNVDARRNALTVETPELVKPGDTATFKLHAAHPTKAVLFAVDEGILQVAHYKLGDPLKFFFRKRVLDVQTSQILDLILPDFKKLMSIAAPGGDNGDAIGRQLNPFKRRRDKPVVYWSGIVDVNGEKDLQYQVPDYFHGKLHVMAVSVSPDLIGTVEGATTVRGDFVLTPDAPTTLAPGDEADVGVGVSNNLTGIGNAPVQVAVTLKAGPQFQIVGSPVKTIALASMHEGVVTFRVRATQALGSGGLEFFANYGDKSAHQRIDVSIRPAAAYRVEIGFGRVDPYSKTVVPNLRRMYDPYSRRDASISTVPAIVTAGLMSWLVNYDNYCTEQITSAAFPRLLAPRWKEIPLFSRALEPAMEDTKKPTGDPLMTQIDALRSRQNEKGGFGLWAATPDAEPFVSAYAMHFLLEARDRGVAVPKDMIDAGNTFLQQLASDESVDTLDGLRQRAYAVYLLSRQGNVTTNYLAAVQKRLQDAYPTTWKDDLAAGWLAASYQLLKQDKQANLLIGNLQRKLERSTDEGYVYEYYDDPLIRDATVLYLLTKHFPERAKALSPRVMENIVRPLERDEFNTLSAAMVMLALDTYASTNANALDKLAIAEIHANGSLKPISGVQAKMLQAGSWSQAATRLMFSDGAAIPAWYVTDQEGYDRDVPSKAIKNGLEIIREYTDTKGNPLTKITLGEEIDVHVKIRATGDKGVADVAIVDLLPGGFDPVIGAPPVPSGSDNNAPASLGPTIRTTGSTWTPLYTDVREDRVVIYGSATPDVQEFIYRIKASAAGRFIVPPAFGEAMYDRRVQARAPGGEVLTVVHAP
ncbi:MAG TPA: MG2 domain-containing protein [Rhizomicrobium sp.]|nr:MG2 domain-containing protein [Rhizomicrobium sp.]